MNILIPDSETHEDEHYRCFVIGPIGNRFEPLDSPARETYEESLEVLEKVIVPACQAFGIEPVRADQISISGEVTEQVLRHIYEDEIVIADVSGGNPNVMYELGLRHTRPLLTIQLGEYGQLPFDIADIRTIQFSRSERGLIDARKALQAAIGVGLGAPTDSIAVSRIWNSVDGPGESLGLVSIENEEPDAPEEEKAEEEGFLERLAAVEALFPEVTKTATAIGSVIEDLGATATSSSEDLNLANASGANTKTRLTIVAKFARDLQEPADELVELTSRFYAEMESIDGQIRGIFRHIENNPEWVAQEGTDSFLDGISALAKSVRESMVHMTGFGGAVTGLSQMSSTLRRPASKIVGAVKKMAETAAFADEWESITHRLRREAAGLQSERVEADQ
ncbi:hypothetical protein [uncultured Plantibacter sp.]|uniref:hypothetical protein n=1 Tax=uncultured Plantibacter sp. TaxID=293337 RepID=UPI0028D3B484|nr:hypothetical protein [uncultured Plantibacter sp.]